MYNAFRCLAAARSRHLRCNSCVVGFRFQSIYMQTSQQKKSPKKNSNKSVVIPNYSCGSETKNKQPLPSFSLSPFLIGERGEKERERARKKASMPLSVGKIHANAVSKQEMTTLILKKCHSGPRRSPAHTPASRHQGRSVHEGFSWSSMAAVVNTVSPGRRLTRPAPLRIALSCAWEMPLLLLLMLPASLATSGSLNFLGGAKSRAVKVPDFRSKCLATTSQ